MNKITGFHQDYLLKKEAKRKERERYLTRKWSQYWVILNGKCLSFYEGEDCQKLVGSIEIAGNSKCVVTKRKRYSYSFMVCAAHGRHLFKCETGQRRHRWMTAIQDAVRLLKSPLSPNLITSEENKNDVVLQQATESEAEDDCIPDDVLPPNVVLVTSFPATFDSPSLPFKILDRSNRHEADTEKGREIDSSRQQPSTTVYPFSRKSLESSHTISDSDREQIASLNLGHHSPFTSLWSTDSQHSPRNRSFPSTPEKSSRPCPVSPQTLSASHFGKSKSLNSLASSSSLTSTAPNMRFSRHMVCGNDFGDIEV